MGDKHFQLTPIYQNQLSQKHKMDALETWLTTGFLLNEYWRESKQFIYLSRPEEKILLYLSRFNGRHETFHGNNVELSILHTQMQIFLQFYLNNLRFCNFIIAKNLA